MMKFNKKKLIEELTNNTFKETFNVVLDEMIKTKGEKSYSMGDERPYKLNPEERADFLSILYKNIEDKLYDQIQDYIISPVKRDGQLWIIPNPQERKDMESLLIKMEEKIDSTMIKMKKENFLKFSEAKNQTTYREEVIKETKVLDEVKSPVKKFLQNLVEKVIDKLQGKNELRYHEKSEKELFDKGKKEGKSVIGKFTKQVLSEEGTFISR